MVAPSNTIVAIASALDAVGISTNSVVFLVAEFYGRSSVEMSR
jgi:hypothetical protein